MREVQRPPWYANALVLIVAAIIWYGFIQQIIFGIPFGAKPASDTGMWGLFLLFGICFPLFFLSMKLVTKTEKEGLVIRFFPISLPCYSISTNQKHPSSALSSYVLRRLGNSLELKKRPCLHNERKEGNMDRTDGRRRFVPWLAKTGRTCEIYTKRVFAPLTGKHSLLYIVQSAFMEKAHKTIAE
jgi:hypothetical protein